MKYIVLTILTGLLCSFSLSLHAQTQGFKWQKSIGTDEYEFFFNSTPAADGGYLLVGSKVVTGRSNEAWIVKINKEGAVEWQKSYGGNNEEQAYNAVATPDGGYIIVGTTNSTNTDGDVTGYHGVDSSSPYWSYHIEDVWVMKLNAAGELLWQKAFGGRRDDYCTGIIRTTDNKYMITGQTTSVDGDLAGKRRSNANLEDVDVDNYDAWVFTIDDAGQMLWQRCYGGNGYDAMGRMLEVENGFVFAGSSSSKELDVVLAHPQYDFVEDCWVFKTDASGNIIWSKTYGGSNFDYGGLIQKTNNGYLIGASTTSDDGDVTGYHPSDPIRGYELTDIWLFELDENGNLVWQQAIGTEDEEELRAMVLQPDNSITLFGNQSAYPDYWSQTVMPVIVKLDAARNITFQKHFDSMMGSSWWSVERLSDHEYLMVGSHDDDYNVPGVHVYGGGADGVIALYSDMNTITGKVFLDGNGNQQFDNGEVLLDKIKVVSNGPSSDASLSYNGVFTNIAGTGSYTSSVQWSNPNYTVSPASYNTSFSAYFNVDTVDFAITPLALKHDLATAIIPVTPARPGFTASYMVKVYNRGTTVQDATMKLVKDPRATVQNTTPVATTMVQDTVSWQLTALAPFDTITLRVNVQLLAPPALNNGDTLHFNTMVTSISTDVTPVDNTDTLKQIVVGAYDPNDKTETHGGVITPDQLSGADPLTYVIRFQNMGTDTAFNITIRDTLDSRLNRGSLEMIGSSHPYQLTISNGNICTWQFTDIKLVNASTNEPLSHGYIAYRILPANTTQVGDTITNSAGIYFDYNLPVATNVQQTIVLNLAALPVHLTSFTATPAGTKVDVKWKTSMEGKIKQFEVQRSVNGVDFTTIGIVQPKNNTHGDSYSFKDASPFKGYNYYRLKSVDIDGSSDLSTIAIVNMSEGVDILSAIYPNPARGQVVLRLQGNVKGNVSVDVIDQLGRTLMTKAYGRQNTSGLQLDLPLQKLPAGNYLVRIRIDDRSYLHQLLIQ